MSWRQTVADWIAPQKPQNSVPLPAVTTNSSTWGDFVGTFANLPFPTEQSALTVSAIYACVNLIAGAVAMLPMDLYKRDILSGEIEQIHGDPLWWVLNEEMTARWMAGSGIEFCMQSLLLHGDWFMQIHRDARSQPMALEPLHPNRITVGLMPNWPGKRLMYGIAPEPLMTGNTVEEQFQVLDQDDIIHVPGFGFNGFRGLSPLRNSLRMTGAVALATQEYAANYFANGARPDFTLEHPNKLDQETREFLKKQLEEQHAGYKNAHKPMLLDGGLKYNQINISNEDAQLLVTRQFQIEEIARMYGVPPWLLGHNEKTTSWGTGIEAIGQAFVRYTLGRHLRKIEKEFNRKLFRTATKHIKFDATEFERSDLKSLFEAFRVAVGRAGEPGWMSVQEVRQKTGLKKEADGTLNPGTPIAAPAAQGATT